MSVKKTCSYMLITMLMVVLIGCNAGTKENSLSIADKRCIVAVSERIIRSANQHDIDSVRQLLSTMSMCRKSMELIGRLPDNKKRAAIALGFPQWGKLKLIIKQQGKSRYIQAHQVPASSISYKLLLVIILTEPETTKLADGKFSRRLVLIPVRADTKIRYLALLEEKPGKWLAATTPEGFEKSDIPDLDELNTIRMTVPMHRKHHVSTVFDVSGFRSSASVAIRADAVGTRRAAGLH